jgi:hypothetical protein
MSFESFLMRDDVQEFFRQLNHYRWLLVGLFTYIALRLIPKTWNEASNWFEKKYKTLILAVALIVILATISFLLYFLLVISPRDYPTGH